MPKTESSFATEALQTAKAVGEQIHISENNSLTNTSQCSITFSLPFLQQLNYSSACNPLLPTSPLEELLTSYPAFTLSIKPALTGNIVLTSMDFTIFLGHFRKLSTSL